MISLDEMDKELKPLIHYGNLTSTNTGDIAGICLKGSNQGIITTETRSDAFFSLNITISLEVRSLN
ncbi:hypothetical protein [Tumidithrix helvetica]|uniref:hypothetical protein n=1 Tax=Tumidithrix helvetica TaxID=3457545 RepID=UPI003CC51947